MWDLQYSMTEMVLLQLEWNMEVLYPGTLICLCRDTSTNKGNFVPVSGASMEKHFGVWLVWKNASGAKHQNTGMNKVVFLRLRPRDDFPLYTVGGKCFFSFARHSQSSWNIKHYLVLQEQSVGTQAVRRKGEYFVLLLWHFVPLLESIYSLAVWSLSVDVWTRDKSCLIIS